jgi:hypothetical protein
MLWHQARDYFGGPWRRVRAARGDLGAARQSSAESIVQLEALSAKTSHLLVEMSSARADLADLRASVEEHSTRAAADHRLTLQALRAVRDDDAGARSKLWQLRDTAEYLEAFEDDDPLVTVIVTTYRNLGLLVERSLPSVLTQSHHNLEVVVVGDAAPAELFDAVASLADPRVRVVNLPYRGPYPDDPKAAWLVSGTTPYNTGLALARGRWIASNSDDDALRPDHITVLLDLARRDRAEAAYGQLAQLRPDGPTEFLGTFPPRHSQWGMQATLMHAGLRFLPLQPSDWMFGVPNDWSLAERMLRIGVRFAYTEQPVVDYYPSFAWTDRLTRDHF